MGVDDDDTCVLRAYAHVFANTSLHLSLSLSRSLPVCLSLLLFIYLSLFCSVTNHTAQQWARTVEQDKQG